MKTAALLGDQVLAQHTFNLNYYSLLAMVVISCVTFTSITRQQLSPSRNGNNTANMSRANLPLWTGKWEEGRVRVPRMCNGAGA